jgi:hypothetical protein
MTDRINVDAVVHLPEPATCCTCGKEFTEHREFDPENCVACHDERTRKAAEAFRRSSSALARAFLGAFQPPCSDGSCPSCKPRKR